MQARSMLKEWKRAENGLRSQCGHHSALGTNRYAVVILALYGGAARRGDDARHHHAPPPFMFPF